MFRDRSEKVDVFRGIAIILIVAGHSGIRDLRWLYFYHVQLFFLIAGMTYNSYKSDSIKNIILCVKDNIIRLYVPFVITGCISWLLNNRLCEMHFLAEIDVIEASLLLKKIWNVILFQETHKLVGPAWFLPCIFLTKMIYILIEYIFKSLKLYTDQFMDLICILIYAISVFSITTGYIFLGWGCSYNMVGISVSIFHLGRRLKNTEKSISNQYFAHYLDW